MQTTHKISGDAAVGFAAYLTATAGRGDYYLGRADGEADEESQGRWLGSPGALGRLGLQSAGVVERDDLLALMRGRSPRTGEPIRRVGADGSRVAGIDLTFSAPKSVSALWAVSGPYRRAQILAAHRGAVESAVGRVEREVAVVRRREDGLLRNEHAHSLVAAEFVHGASRLTRDQETGGVPDPQLHSHVVLLAAERVDGQFAAIDSRELFRSARVNGAWYRAELAWRLGELGLEVRGRAGRDERYFELAGVPSGLTARWSTRTAEVEAAARRFRQRYGRDPRGGELGALTVATRGTKASVAEVGLEGAWQAVAEEYGLGARQARELFGDRARHEQRDLARELLGDAVADRSMVSDRDLHARALELSAGVTQPDHANVVVDELERSGELLRLEDGWWTTRELRDLERQTVAVVADRAGEEVAVVSEAAREAAQDSVSARLGAALSAEQRAALARITGRGGVTMMVGQAGTGKGVVIDAAREAWEREGHRVIGIAVAGAPAERLGVDAHIDSAMTIDALLWRHNNAHVALDERTVVVMDEAGMADTRRLAAVTDVTARSGSKLVLVGDGAQLSPIGPGGLFDVLREHAPTAELERVYRAQEEWEQRAWGQLRRGQAQRALGEYQARRRLHIEGSRLEAVTAMVGDWDRVRLEHAPGQVVMLSDASNDELDRINALAQQARTQAGELTGERVALPGRPYGLAAGDEVIFTGQLRPAGQDRVNNGTRARITDIDPATSRVLTRTVGSQPREVGFSTDEFTDVRLAYAQHVYKAQGLTVDRALVLTGGWHTDRERAYVALSRARERTDLYVSREDLGEEGLDAGAIQRLGQRLANSRADQPSVTRATSTPEAVPEHDAVIATTRSVLDEQFIQSSEMEVDGDESEVAQIMREQREREQARRHEQGLGIE